MRSPDVHPGLSDAELSEPENRKREIQFDNVGNLIADAHSCGAGQAEVDAHSCWFDYFSADQDCSPFAAVLMALEERKGRKQKSWSRFWHVPKGVDTDHWQRLTRFHSLAEEKFQF